MVSFHHRYLNEAAVLHEQFRAARVARRWTIDRVAHALAIAPSYIQAIEEGRWSVLPGGVYTRQFVRRYAEFLGLDRVSVLEALDAPPGAAWASLEQRRLDVPEIPRVAVWPWQRMQSFIILVIVLSVGWYFSTRVLAAFEPPFLTVDSPTVDLAVTEPLVRVQGKSEPGASLTVNDIVVPLRPDGIFSTSLVLLQGQNTIRIVATGRHGKPHVVERVVTVVQPQQKP